MVTYTISNFVEIHNIGFDYKLPRNVLNTIRSFHEKLKGNPEQVKHISFKKIGNFNFNSAASSLIKKEEKENTSLNARLILNKITAKTYLDCLDKIQQIIQTTTKEEELNNIAEVIFDISASNRFYSKMYADLYSTIISTHPIFLQYYNTKYEMYFDSFETIEYVDPNIDYDRFCEINIKNEKRK